MRGPLIALAFALPCLAQTLCQPPSTYSPCDITFELSDQEASANPNPYVSVQIEAEMRSPRFRTFRAPAFWDGGRRLVVRFAPTDAGEWTFRVTSNIPRFDGKEGRLTATESSSPGFLQPANVHHWAYVDENVKKPHLWMGDTLYPFPYVDRSVFDKLVETRAAQKFNHIRGVVLPRGDLVSKAFAAPDRPEPAYFSELDSRILAMNRKGIIADLVLAWDDGQLTKTFPEARARARYYRYVAARYAAMDVTWQGLQEFEKYEDGRALLKEMGDAIKQLDPYHHPRTTHALVTSSPLLPDGWMDYVGYQSSDDQLGAIEHQLYAVPFVNFEFAYEDTGAGKRYPHHVDSDAFRHRLWNITMDGQSPTFGNTGTYGGMFPVDPKYVESPGARAMTAWFDFFSRTRYWELEPYFDVDGGRALALERPNDEQIEGIEYIVYLEKPGPVEIAIQKHSYEVSWFNPITGETVQEKRKFKGDRFSGQPPDTAHDWVLHISREGRKQSLRSFKFESRAILMQEIEANPQKVPFAIVEPASDTISVSKPPQFAVKLTRENRATRSMMYLWTGEVPGGDQGFRVLGTGPQGTWSFAPHFPKSLPASLTLRLYGMNANGKVYSLLRVYNVTR